MSVEQRNLELSRAKIALMNTPNSVFYATVLFSLKFQWDEAVPTAATEGTTLKMNPKFFDILDKDGRVFVMCHEAMHVAYLHTDPSRYAGRNLKKWIVACDHVINLQLIDAGFKMPTGILAGLADRKFTGMSVEQVYDKLPNDVESDMEDIIEGSMSPEQQQELKDQVQDIVMQAAMQSQMAGEPGDRIPEGIRLLLDKLLNPKLPWQTILRRYLSKFTKGDYSWKKPNRRFFPTHILPSLHSQKISNLAFAVDISGSVSDKDFAYFISEIAQVFKMLRPEKITVIQFDTDIQHVDECRSLNQLLKIQFDGRGGTDVECVVEWTNKNKPEVILFFTDGEFYFRDSKIEHSDTIWMIHDNKRFTAPYGKVIHYEMD